MKAQIFLYAALVAFGILVAGCPLRNKIKMLEAEAEENRKALLGGQLRCRIMKWRDAEALQNQASSASKQYAVEKGDVSLLCRPSADGKAVLEATFSLEVAANGSVWGCIRVPDRTQNDGKPFFIPTKNE